MPVMVFVHEAAILPIGGEVESYFSSLRDDYFGRYIDFRDGLCSQ